ncbi:DegV family protein [Howardella ureilytica]|nr:DegV family protein [Lachnospiraceae bacterium]
MKKIIITTESGSDVPQHLAEKYDIKIIPMHVVMDGKSYDDGVTDPDVVFEYFERTGKVPTTSCVNTHEYTDFFNKLQEENPDSFIYHFSYASRSSATYEACHIALEQGHFKNIYLIDTKSVSGGCTAYIIEAIKHIDNYSGSLDSDEDYIKLGHELDKITDKIECNFIPATLEYLKAGGRVSNAKALIAGILKLHPLIEIDENGVLIASKKYRGNMAKVCEKFLPDFFEKFDLNKDIIYLMYGKGLDKSVLDRMKELATEYGFKNIEYVMTGCVISCHGGKGAIGLAGVKK